jgi:hypothetical protein
VAYGKLQRTYIVEGGYTREPEPVASPQSTILHSTGNTSVKQEVGHSNTRRTVRLCSISTEITAAHSIHFQHLMWTKGY